MPEPPRELRVEGGNEVFYEDGGSTSPIATTNAEKLVALEKEIGARSMECDSCFGRRNRVVSSIVGDFAPQSALRF